VRYELNDGEIVVKDEVDRVIWRGKPDGHPATAIVPLPDSDDAIVLLDYMAGPKNFANLFRITSTGRIVWRAAPPESSTSDAYVEVRRRGDAFFANSWSGFLVQIDIKTGMPTSSEFVK
jgi:hypothetical protein